MPARYPAFVEAQLREVQGHSLPHCDSAVAVRQPASGAGPPQHGLCDRCILCFTFVGVPHKWHCIYSAHDREAPPDFIFQYHTQAFCPPAVKAWVEWDPDDGMALYHILCDLVQSYRAMHKALAAGHSSKTVSGIAKELADSDMKHDVFLETTLKAVFRIRLAGLGQKSVGPLAEALETPLVLTLTCEHATGGFRVEPSLVVPDKVVEVIGPVQAPPWGVRDLSLGVYVELLRSSIEMELDAYRDAFVARRQYVASFLSHFGSALVEYDVELFRKIVFLFEVQGFHVFTIIELGEDYPRVQPTFTLQSVYHLKNGKPISAVRQSYPYSPRWEGPEMASRAREYFKAEIAAFREMALKGQ